MWDNLRYRVFGRKTPSGYVVVRDDGREVNPLTLLLSGTRAWRAVPTRWNKPATNLDGRLSLDRLGAAWAIRLAVRELAAREIKEARIWDAMGVRLAYLAGAADESMVIAAWRALPENPKSYSFNLAREAMDFEPRMAWYVANLVAAWQSKGDNALHSRILRDLGDDFTTYLIEGVTEHG